jgi:hypothetical protein
LLPYKLFPLAQLFLFVLNCCVFFGGNVIAGVCGACFFTTQVPALQKLIGDRVLVDLLAQMLEYDPDRRITADKALLVVTTTIVAQVYACLCVFDCVWYVCALIHADIYIHIHQAASILRFGRRG